MVDLWSASMEGRGQSSETIRRRTETYKRFALSFDPLGATGHDIEAWLLGLKVKPASRASYLGDLKAFYRWARRRDIVDTDPTDLIDGFRKPTYTPRPARREDVSYALERAPDRIRRIILLGTLAGLRRAEIAALHTDDVNDGHLRVNGKGGKVRIVPMHPRLAAELRGVPNGPVVPNQYNGEHLTPYRIGTMLSKFLRGLGIDATSHQNRHRFGADSYESCHDLRTVQKLMGHASSQTTEGYVPFNDAAAIAAIRGMTSPESLHPKLF